MGEIGLLHPLWLALLPLALALGLLDGWRAQATPRRVGAALRGAALALLVLGLAQPVWRAPAERSTTVHLVDVSTSVAEGALQDALTAAERGAGEATGTQPDLVLFAETAVAVGPGQSAAALAAELRGPASDLDAGLDLALALLPPDGAARLVVHTDGTARPGGAALGRLDARGVEVVVAPLAPAARAPRVLDLDLPAVPLSPGATLDLEATVWGGPEGLTGPIELWTDGAQPLASVEVQIDPGARASVALTATVPEAAPGLLPLTLVAGPDRLETALRVRRTPVIRLVGMPRETRALAAMLRAEEMAVSELRPDDGAGWTAADLEEVDLVAIVGAPTEPGPDRPAALDPAIPRSLEAFVRSGGGLIAVGGEFAYDQGGWHDSPLGPLLPVTLDPDAEEEKADVTLVIALDKSGSMAQSAARSPANAAANLGARIGARTVTEGSKIQVVSRAALAAVELLRPDDRVGVLAVDTEVDWVVPLQTADRRVRVMDGILGIGAGGGGIFVYATLAAAQEALASSDTRLRHLILFADTGDAVQQTDPETGKRAEELVAEMAAEDEVTVSVIGVGGPNDRDVAFLRRLAEAGDGRFAQTETVQGLKTLFVAETERVLGQGLDEEQPVRARRVGMHPALSGVGIERAPALRGMNKVERKPGARTLVVGGPSDRPLLATARVGRGQVAAWTSDVTGRWAGPWDRWSGQARLWTQLVRSHARTEAGPEGLVLSEQAGRVVVTSRGPDGLSVARPGLELVLVAEDGTERRLDRTLDAPGVWSATPGLTEGARARVEARGPAGALLGARDVVGPPEAERGAVTADPAAFAALERPGGAPRPGRAGWPIGRWLWVLAALLLPAEAWLRRTGPT